MPDVEFEERFVTFEPGWGPQRGVAHRFPKVEPRFSSPLVNTRNLEIGGGAPADEYVDRVIEGHKPVGFASDKRPEVMRACAVRALQAGRGAQCHQHTGEGWSCWFTSASQVGPVGEHFDIDALIADYKAYLSSHPSVAEVVAEELGRIRRSDMSSFLEFSDVEVELGLGPKTPVIGQYARCGLLLGYPAWSTAALIGAQLGLSGYVCREAFL
jgi:hypothetical protein